MNSAAPDGPSHAGSLPDTLAEGIYTIDREGVITAANGAFLRMMGFAGEAEVVGRDLHAVIRRGGPDGSAHPASACPIRRCASEGVAAHAVDEVFHRPDGAVLPVEYWVRPILDDSGPAGAICGVLDVSARRQAEHAVREAQDRLERTLGAAQIVGIWDWDLINDRIVADERFARLHVVDPGRAAAGLPAGDFQSAVHPDDRVRAEQEIEQAVATGAPFASEYRLVQPGGAIRHVLARGRCVRDAAGRPARCSGVVIDITMLRHAEQTLTITQRAGQIGSFELHPDSGLIEASEEFWRIYGLPPRSGPTPAEVILPLIVAGQGPTEVMGTAETSPNPLGIVEYRIRRPSDGAVRWIGRRGQAVLDSGRRRYLGVVVDITERVEMEQALRASEAQFRTFAQAMPSHVWACTPDGQLDWFNQWVFDYTGESHAALAGEGWVASMHPEDVPAVGALWAESLATGTPYESELRLRRADGVYRWHIARAVPIRGADGAISRWIGTNTDIDEQKSDAAALAELNETLERRVEARTQELMASEESLRQAQKMEAVGQLTGGIAHDFNNILTGVIGSLDMIQRRLEAGRTDGLERYVTAAVTSAQRAASLTHRLLAFARRQSLDTRPADVNALVAGMHDLIQQSLGEQVEFQTFPAPRLWPAMTDANQLESALLNLAINARDAMPNGGRLTVETANTHLDEAYGLANDGVAAGDYVMLSVSDTGTGMSAGVMAKAFDPFFTTKPIGQGTGLGLSMIYGFVKQCRGHVRIYSEAGQGTSVKLYLPRAPRKAAKAADRTAGVAGAGRGETVLVVEDDPTVRLLITEVLEARGYLFLETGDAREAISILESSQPIDLLVTDVGLPHMNGRQLAEIARQNRPDLKILFVTGYAENAAVRGGFLEPGMDMMTKPFALEALAAKIRLLIET